jgi:hypothetical protein
LAVRDNGVADVFVRSVAATEDSDLDEVAMFVFGSTDADRKLLISNAGAYERVIQYTSRERPLETDIRSSPTVC